MGIRFNPEKHVVFDFLTFEYYPLDEFYLKEETEFSEEDINDLKKGLEMERQGWGFLEHKHLILFRGKNSNLKDRTYFIATPDRIIFPTNNLYNQRLHFGDSASILLSEAGNYFGICRNLLDETAFERAGSI